MEHLDVEAFIVEIRQRPVIWDIKCSDYALRDKKKSAWEEIVNSFIGKEDATVQEKREFGLQLQRRWKSLRDSYAREVRLQKQVKSGRGSRKRPIYIYFKQLSFLETVIGNQPLPNLLADNDEHLSPTFSPPLQRSTSPISKRKKQDPVDERLVNITEKSVQSVQERESQAENDCDRMFLLSLLDPLKEIPEFARFGVKRKLMDLLDSELQFYGKINATAHASQHQFCRTNSSNSETAVSTQLLTTANHPSASLQRPSSSEEQRCETDKHSTPQLLRVRYPIWNCDGK